MEEEEEVEEDDEVKGETKEKNEESNVKEITIGNNTSSEYFFSVQK